MLSSRFVPSPALLERLCGSYTLCDLYALHFGASREGPRRDAAVMMAEAM